MFEIDDPLPQETLERLAAHIPEIDPVTIRYLGEWLHHDQSEEFYRGMANGLAAALHLLKIPGGVGYVSATLSLISEHILRPKDTGD